MKRYAMAALAALMLVPGGLAVAARAQDDAPAGREEGGPPPDRREKMQDRMAEMLQKNLELTDDQAAKFKDAQKAHQDAMKPLHRKMEDLMTKLGRQVEDKAGDGELRKTLDALKDARKSVEAEQEKFHSAVEGVLTPSQQAKFVLGMMHRMKARMGMGERGQGRGMRGGGMGPRGGMGMGPGGDRQGPPPQKDEDGDGD